MDGPSDTDALAGQTFYRTANPPAASGQNAYIGIMNPAGSGINTYIDAMYVYPGLPTEVAEIGVIHYNTPFNQAPFNNVSQTFFCATKYGCPNSKTVLWQGTYAGPVEPQEDYIFMGPTNTQEPRLMLFPYPIIICPGDGIVMWMSAPGYEWKAGIWLREK